MKPEVSKVPISGRADVKDFIAALRSKGVGGAVELPTLIPAFEGQTTFSITSENEGKTEWVGDLEFCKIPVASLRIAEDGNELSMEFIELKKGAE